MQSNLSSATPPEPSPVMDPIEEYHRWFHQWKEIHQPGTVPTYWEIWMASRKSQTPIETLSMAGEASSPKPLFHTEAWLQQWMRIHGREPTLREIWVAAQTSLLNQIRTSGCSCDPPGSGEEYCLGHCYLREEINARDRLLEQLYASVHAGDLVPGYGGVITGVLHTLISHVKSLDAGDLTAEA